MRLRLDISVLLPFGAGRNHELRTLLTPIRSCSRRPASADTLDRGAPRNRGRSGTPGRFDLDLARRAGLHAWAPPEVCCLAAHERPSWV